jgi:hypothetical protein
MENAVMQHAQERVSSLLAEVERLVREDTLPAPAKREVLTAVRAARDATTAAASRESVRPSYEFSTPSGVVQFSRRIMWFYPAAAAPTHGRHSRRISERARGGARADRGVAS